MLSKETTAQPGALPQIEALEWHAYRGGSYDGFEEMGFTLLFGFLLTPILALFTLAVMRGRWPRSSRPLHPTGGPVGTGRPASVGARVR
jgi:hypothetical protein